MLSEEFKKEFASLLEVPSEVIEPKFNLREGAIWDSLSILGAIALIDQYFNVIINGEKLNNICVYGELELLIKEAI